MHGVQRWYVSAQHVANSMHWVHHIMLCRTVHIGVLHGNNDTRVQWVRCWHVCAIGWQSDKLHWLHNKL